MRIFSIYWTYTINNNDEVFKKTENCDIIAKDLVKAFIWLESKYNTFKVEYVTSIYSYDVIVAE